MGRNQDSACRVSIVTGFVLVFLSLAISVGVGLIMFFALGKDNDCRCDEASVIPTSEALEQQCIAKVFDGEGQTVCKACQPITVLTTPKFSTTTHAPEEEARDYRLPITVRPYLYAVELQPNIYGGDNGVFDFEGSVTISGKADKIANSIVLHARFTLNIVTQSVRVRDLNSSLEVEVSDQTFDKRREFFVLHLAESLVVDHHYEIYVEFNSPLATDGRGLFLTHYLENGRKVYVVASHLEAPRARRIFPCFDEPGLKAQFDITLVRRNGGERVYTTLANTRLLRMDRRQNGMVADVYARTVVMPTYLLAFIVSDFKHLENQTNGVTYRTWAGTDITTAAKAQQYGVAIFNKLEEHFNPDYPLTKLDNIAVPDFGPGAMENWGLIIYRTRLLYQTGESTGSDELWTAEVIAHEIAHQWFGNLVSPKWWNWLWLNEAFASFWDYQTVAELYPSWNMLERHVAISTHGSMATDSKQSSHPMSPEEDSIQSPTKVMSLFDTITYSKGANIIRMMDLAMGRSLFIKGLNRYLTAHAYGNTEHQDLWNALTEEARLNSVNLNMTEIMDPWVTQMNYPVVNVHVAQNSVRFTQERFLSEYDRTAEHDAAKYGYKWTIPITFTTSNSPNFTTGTANNGVTYLKVNQHQLELSATVPKNGWIVVNLQECGYFRVNYDVTNWNNLINFLENDDHTVIHSINRAQIINDAWNLAMAGRLDLSIALRTLNYIQKEVAYAPWRTFDRQLSDIDDMLENSELYGRLQQFMKKTVKTAYTTLGAVINENISPASKVDISQIVRIACRYEYQPCIDTALSSFRAWMNNTSNSISPDLRSTFYCTAVRHGGQSEWQFVYGQYHHTHLDTQKTRLRNALACTREPYLLQRVLEMSLDSAEVTDKDMISVIKLVADNRWGRDASWDFLVYNLKHLSDLRKSAKDMKSLILGTTKKYNTEQELHKVKAVYDDIDLELIAEVKDGFVEAIEKIEKNIEWMRKYRRTFSTWFTARNV